MANLRISTLYYPPYFDKDIRGQPTGFNWYRQLLQIVRQSGINATYVYASSLGNFENGVYEGVIGHVYNNSADTALFYCTMDTFPPPGKFGPVQAASEVQIVSRSEMQTSIGLTFLSCLDIFGKWINLSILVSLLLIALPLTRHHAHHSIIAIISQMFKQNFSHLSPFSILPHLSMILWLLFIHVLHAGLYTTNSVVVLPPEQVESLGDIIVQNKTPAWFEATPVKKYFESGATKEAAAVWEKAEQLNVTNCILSNARIVELLSDVKEGKPYSMILSKQTIDTALPSSCQLREKEVLNGSLRFYRSKSIVSTLSAAVISSNLTNERASLSKMMSYNIFEFGLIEYFEKEQIRDLDQSAVNSNCSRKLFKSDAEDEPETVNLKLDHVLRAIVLYFLALIAISSLLILELFMSFGINHASFPVRVTTIIEIEGD